MGRLDPSPTGQWGQKYYQHFKCQLYPLPSPYSPSLPLPYSPRIGWETGVVTLPWGPDLVCL